jgi:hypothetical protein
MHVRLLQSDALLCADLVVLVLQFIGSMFGVPAWGPRLERLQDTFVSKSLAV